MKHIRKMYQLVMIIMKKEFAENWKNGSVKFSTILSWLGNGDGKIDNFEGALYYKKDEILIRRNNITKIPVLCFYGIEAKDGMLKIDNSYVNDFIKDNEGNINRENYRIVIIDYVLFYNELIKSLRKIGFSEKDWFWKSIDYHKDYEEHLSSNPYPYELFEKRDFYSHQSEVRFILKDNKKALEKMFQNDLLIINDNSNYIVDVYEIPLEKEKFCFNINANEYEYGYIDDNEFKTLK